MGTGTTVAGVGLGLVAVGALVVAAIKFLPGLLDGISNFKFPEFPEFPEFPKFPELPGFPEIPNPFAPNIRQNLPAREFTSIEKDAFSFRELIGRPAVLGGEIFVNSGGKTSIRQVDPNAPAPKNRLIFGSDFASPARLSDLFSRFKKTGRLEPGGRERRIAELIAQRDVSILKSIFPSKSLLPKKGTLAAKGPNSLGTFGAKGVRTKVKDILVINRSARPTILRTRVLAGFTKRASGKTRAFFASGAAGARGRR